MRYLIKFYVACLTSVAVVVALCAYLIPTHLAPMLVKALPNVHWLIGGLSVITSRPAFVVVLAMSEWIIRKKLWKWVHPEFDFAGLWKGTSTYEQVHIGTAPVPHRAEHEVVIEQDCLSICIAPSTGKLYVNWKSLAINLVDEHKLVYAYEVHYGKRADFPTDALGYEEMDVVQRGKRRRPSLLTGKFYHCAIGKEPVYSGTVEFKRQ